MADYRYFVGTIGGVGQVDYDGTMGGVGQTKTLGGNGLFGGCEYKVPFGS